MGFGNWGEIQTIGLARAKRQQQDQCCTGQNYDRGSPGSRRHRTPIMVDRPDERTCMSIVAVYTRVAVTGTVRASLSGELFFSLFVSENDPGFG